MIKYYEKGIDSDLQPRYAYTPYIWPLLAPAMLTAAGAEAARAHGRREIRTGYASALFALDPSRRIYGNTKIRRV